MTEHACSKPLGAEPIRVLLVDDQKHVLWGLNKLIEGEWPCMAVAGAASTVSEALSAVTSRKADVVVLDMYMGEANSLDYLARMLEIGGAPVIVVTGRADPDLQRRAIQCGASAVVLKADSAERLLHEIERAYKTCVAGDRA